MTLTDEDRALIAEGLYDAFWARAQSKHPENRVEKTPFRNAAAAIQSMWSDIAEDAAALLSAARQARTLEPGEGWEVLADELRKPQFMTTTSGGRKHTLEFTFHGEEGREARDRLHDAILLAPAPPASLIKEG